MLMLKKLAQAVLAAVPLTLALGLAGCGGTNDFTVKPKELEPGGVFITYVQPTGCSGCEALGRKDLIQSVDGKPVKTTEELLAANLTDGNEHTIEFLDSSADGAAATATISATPNDTMDPIKGAPPFWTVGAEELNLAPPWARRRLFGHAAPQVLLVNSDGGLINGRDLYGKPHLMVFFDWAAASERQDGAMIMQVLQKAQGDLKAKGVEIIFAQIMHPSQRARQPMNDTDLRQFFTDNQVSATEGGPLPPPPLYRMPNRTEDNPARVLGLQGSFTFLEAVGEAPNIFVLDENAVIRWHSAGTEPDPEPDPNKALPAAVYTINEAVLFTLNKL